MPHVIEAATSGRAKCRGCGRPIAAGELRFGERLPNPFTDDDSEMTHWFHLACGAYRRPEPWLEAFDTTGVPMEDRDVLARDARRGCTHRRLPRVNVAERATSGRARCRHCREPIEKDEWRISLVFYEEGRFVPSGFIHARCARGYLGTADIETRLRRFTPDLTEEQLADIRSELSR